MSRALSSRHYPTAVSPLRLRLFLDQAEDRLQGRTADEEGRMASVDGGTTAAMAEAEEEVEEEAGSKTGDSAEEVYRLASGEEARRHQSGSLALVEGVGDAEVGTTGVIEAGEEGDGSRKRLRMTSLLLEV